MNIILDTSDILYQIINQSGDIQDWLNFMSSCKQILQNIYPKFILKQFTFMALWHTYIPPCVENNIRFKMFKTKSQRYPQYTHTRGSLCLISDQDIIYGHSQLYAFSLYQTQGFFAQNLIIY